MGITFSDINIKNEASGVGYRAASYGGKSIIGISTPTEPIICRINCFVDMGSPVKSGMNVTISHPFIEPCL